MVFRTMTGNGHVPVDIFKESDKVGFPRCPASLLNGSQGVSGMAGVTDKVALLTDRSSQNGLTIITPSGACDFPVHEGSAAHKKKPLRTNQRPGAGGRGLPISGGQ